MSDAQTLYLLDKIAESLESILQRAEGVHSTDDLLSSPGGMLLLDGICMKLIAVGESIKRLDKITAGELLPRYPDIPWRDIMGMRDIIVHHYFEVDADVVFATVRENVPPLLATIYEMEAMIKNLR